MEAKRYKMYKAGKNWMVACAATLTVVASFGTAIAANADTTASTTNTTASSTSSSVGSLSDFGKALDQLSNASQATQQQAIKSITNVLTNPTPVVQQTQAQQQSNDVYATLAGYGIDKNSASEYAAGDGYYTKVVDAKIAQLTGDNAVNARKLVDQMRDDYRKANKSGVWGVANHDAYEYANPNLSDKQNAAFAKGEEVQIVSMIKDGGKLRYKIADGNYVAAVHVDINMDYTNMDEYNAMVSATTQLRPVVKHEVKKASTTYYVKTPKGKKHVVAIKKSVVAHVTKSFKDSSAKNKKNILKAGAKVSFKKVVKAGSTYRLQLMNGHFITANKAFVRVVK